MKFQIPSIETVKGWINGFRESFKMLRTFLFPPMIEAKLLGEINDCWQLEIRNRGGTIVVSRVFLEDVTDDKGQSTGDVTSPVELYRLHSLDTLRLFGEARALYGIYGPRPESVLTVCWGQDDQKTIGVFPISYAGDKILVIRVVFYSADFSAKELTDKVLRYFAKFSPSGVKISLFGDRKHR